MTDSDVSLDVIPSSQESADSRLTVKYVGLDTRRFEAISHSTADLVESLFSHRSPSSPSDCVWPLVEAIWPATSTKGYRDVVSRDVCFTLVPLSRIGQTEGKSGSLVLIGYLSDRRRPDVPPSHPLVVKTGPASTSKLKNEYRNAVTIRPYAYEHKDVFSIPFRLDEKQQFDVLWSLFSASGKLWDEAPDNESYSETWKVRDLREPILKNDFEAFSSVARATFETMHNLHVPFGRRRQEARPVIEEYDWYLRDFGKEAGWGAEWQSLFGGATSATVAYAGREWANPVWLVEQLKRVSCDLTIGAVHGDLHPGNIVISPSNHPRLIDFGWAQEDAHIAKDFVLMECNLRFMFLQPQLPLEEVQRFSNWVNWNADVPQGLSTYVERRCNMVQQIRSLAAGALGEQVDWDREYLIPLFLVAFGLLRYGPQLGNQQAAIFTVLALASHLRETVITSLE